jgi:hypothetical protein
MAAELSPSDVGSEVSSLESNPLGALATGAAGIGEALRDRGH